MKNSNDTIGNRSRDLPVPQPLRHRVPSIIQYKPTKCTFSNWMFLIFHLLKPSTCFEPEGSSSGRRLYEYIQLWYGTVTCISISSLAPSSTFKTAYTDTSKHIILYWCIHPSSGGSTLGFETCRSLQKLKLKILIWKWCILLVYIV
jgi:hypothetical protein